MSYLLEYKQDNEQELNGLANVLAGLLIKYGDYAV
jgi:hypothetical protein